MNNITLEEKKAAFKKLLEVGNLSALSEKERSQYECNLKHYRVYMSQLDYAREEGIVLGVEKEKLQTAVAMKADGITSPLIVKYTGLDLEQVEKL